MLLKWNDGLESGTIVNTEPSISTTSDRFFSISHGTQGQYLSFRRCCGQDTTKFWRDDSSLCFYYHACCRWWLPCSIYSLAPGVICMELALAVWLSSACTICTSALSTLPPKYNCARGISLWWRIKYPYTSKYPTDWSWWSVLQRKHRGNCFAMIGADEVWWAVIYVS